MGFYIDLNPIGPNGREYRETGVPPVFWALYTIAGFALLCMGLAAHTLLGDLARSGSTIDIALVSMVLLSVPFYLLIGIKLGAVRRFVSFSGSELKVGFLAGKIPLFQRTLSNTNIKDIQLLNRRPSPNVAAVRHDDSQYYIRGHWRVVAILNNGKEVTLDRHTEKGALETLYKDLLFWKGN